MEVSKEIKRKQERKKQNKLIKLKRFIWHRSAKRQYDFQILIHRNKHRFNRKPILVMYKSFTFEFTLFGICLGFTYNYGYKEQDFTGISRS